MHIDLIIHKPHPRCLTHACGDRSIMQRLSGDGMIYMYRATSLVLRVCWFSESPLILLSTQPDPDRRPRCACCVLDLMLPNTHSSAWTQDPALSFVLGCHRVQLPSMVTQDSSNSFVSRSAAFSSRRGARAAHDSTVSLVECHSSMDVIGLGIVSTMQCTILGTVLGTVPCRVVSRL